MKTKVAILILAHKSIDYFLNLADRNKNILFFVHFDKKYDHNLISVPSNLIVLAENNRVDVRWGGYSQVQAMINIFHCALQNKEVEFFHLVSGEDVLLSEDELAAEFLMWNNSDIFMDIQNSLRHRFRVRFFAPHVETKWQRKMIGKLFTFSLKILDKIIPTKKDFWFGSNWFSIRRNDLKKILDLASSKDLDFFKSRLNPDEHFFQYLVVRADLKEKISPLGNNRYIIFDKNYNNGNNPIYLSDEELLSVKNKVTHFFARKVDVENQLKYYERVNAK